MVNPMSNNYGPFGSVFDFSVPLLKTFFLNIDKSKLIGETVSYFLKLFLKAL